MTSAQGSRAPANGLNVIDLVEMDESESEAEAAKTDRQSSVEVVEVDAEAELGKQITDT